MRRDSASDQSSVVVMLRGLVMLVCLVAIPLAALFGSSLPKVVKALEERRWPTLAELKGATSRPANSPTEPLPFVPAGTPAPAPTAVVQSPGTTAAPDLSQRRPGDAVDATVSAVMPVRYDQAADPPANRDRPAAPQPNPASTMNAVSRPRDFAPAPPPGAGLVPIDSPDSRNAGGSNSALGASEPPPLPPRAATSDPYTYIQDRLRQLGATYYLLESWGDQRHEFRFYCRMAVGGNPQYTHAFWAIDSDPLRAMGEVLRQVEQWRSGSEDKVRG
jgi:hypothetical protein